MLLFDGRAIWRVRHLVVVAGALACVLALSAAPGARATGQSDLGMSHLRAQMDKNLDFNVYTDWRHVSNHFVPSGWMLAKKSDGSAADPSWYTQALALQDYRTDLGNPRGSQAIKVTWTPSAIPDSNTWAGMYWQQTEDNWGTVANAGFNLTGADKITFWARGAAGG